MWIFLLAGTNHHVTIVKSEVLKVESKHLHLVTGYFLAHCSVNTVNFRSDNNVDVTLVRWHGAILTMVHTGCHQVLVQVLVTTCVITLADDTSSSSTRTRALHPTLRFARNIAPLTVSEGWYTFCTNYQAKSPNPK